MATGDGWTSKLIAGLAQHLADNGIGVWRTNGVYTANEIGILVRAIPQSPDRIIALAPYPVASPPGLADLTQGIQIRLRGDTDPRTCDDLGDAVFELCDSATNLTFGGVRIVQMYRQSFASLGADANGRWEASHNYYLDAMRPTLNRT